MIQWYNDMMIMWYYNDDNMMIAIEKQPKTLNWVIPPHKRTFWIEISIFFTANITNLKKMMQKKQFRLMMVAVFIINLPLHHLFTDIYWYLLLVDSSLLDVAGPHRCSWIGENRTLGMYKLLIVTARQQGKKISCFVYPFGCVLVVGLPTRYFLNNDTTL